VTRIIRGEYPCLTIIIQVRANLVVMASRVVMANRVVTVNRVVTASLAKSGLKGVAVAGTKLD
jgi:hypothetical protein